MKKLVVIAILLKYISMQAQIYPDYKVPVPDILTLNHACMQGNMQQLFQNVAGTSDPSSAQFTHVTSDAAGNLYFTGYADFTVNPPTNPNFPYATPSITFGSNSANPITQTRPAEHKFFVAKYSVNGNPSWVGFLSENPTKLLWEESTQKLYLTFAATGNGISFNGTMMPLDSAYQGNEIVILTLSSDGSYYNFYKNRFTYDFILAGGKKILVYRRQYTTTYFETRFGFFENNQVVKWQNPPSGTFDFIHNLFYNHYDNSLWFLGNSKDKYYRLFLSTTDTLIFENIARNLNQETGIPIENVKSIDKFHFLPDGGYIGEYYTQYNVNGNSPMKVLKLVRMDASNNVIWRTKFSPQNDMWHKAIVDGNGDVWIDLPTTFYYDKCNAITAGKEYTLNPWGNVGVVNNYLLQLDGATGDIKNAYINGYGNVNYSMEISLYTNMQLLHVATGNKLITTPQIGAVAYYPDASGNFKPYYTTCTNQLLPSQFMWVSFDLNNLVSYKREEQSEEEVYKNYFSNQSSSNLFIYPNPNQGQFTIQTENGGVFELMDITGKVLNTYIITSNVQTLNVNLPAGMYFIREKGSGFTHKLIIE